MFGGNRKLKRRNRICRRIAIALTVALLAGQSHAFVLAEESVGDAPQTEISSEEIGADTPDSSDTPDGDGAEDNNATEQGDENNAADQDVGEDNTPEAGQEPGGNGNPEDDQNTENNPPDGKGEEDTDDDEDGQGQCICETACTEDAVNVDCPVCAADYANCAKDAGEGVIPPVETSLPETVSENVLDAEAGIATLADEETFEYDNFRFVVTGNSQVKVLPRVNHWYSGDLVVPGTVDHDSSTYSVTSIGGFGGLRGYDLISVKLPDGMEIIENSAFENCKTLKEVKIPDSLKSIGESAFAGCYALKHIEFPDRLEVIGNMAFQISGLEGIIEIPNSVKSIGQCAFYGSRIEGIKIPDGIESIEDQTFEQCYNLKSFVIPDSVNNIGWAAFSSCFNLENIKIPDGVTSVGEYAFINCEKLKNINIPNQVTSIEESTMQGCTELSSVKISNRITDIKAYAFKNCKSLTELQIVVCSGEKLQFPKVGEEAFIGLPGTRYIVFVDECGEKLTGAAYKNAKAAFTEAAKNDNNPADNPDDGKWWGWSLKETSEIENTHTVTISVKKDDSDWVDHGRTFALSKDGTAFVTDLEAVEAGTYTVYDITGLTADEFQEKGMNTGVPVTVGDADTSATVEYYTVTFCDYDAAAGETAYGDGTDQKPQTVLKTVGRVVEPKTNPTKEGHDFAGWVTAPGGDVKFDFAGTPITEKDTRIYASWTEKTVPVDTYTVTFYDGTQAYGEDTPQKPQTVSAGQKAAKPADPEKTGWKFAGWKTADGGSYDFDTPVTGTTGIYASWVKETAEQFHITATATEGGDIAPEGDITVTEGGEQTFTITPDEGNKIKTVTVDSMDVTGELKDTLARAQAGARYYTFTNVTENHTIRAEFESDGNTPGGGDNPTPGGDDGDNPNPGGGDDGDNPNPGGGGDNPTPGGNGGDNQNPGGGSDTGGSGGGNSGDSGGNSGGGDSAGNGQTAVGSETTSLQAGSGAAGTSAGINTASDGSKAADESVSSESGQTAGTTGSAVSGSALSASGQTADVGGTAAGGREPGTGDTAHMEVYATIAMIAGLTYLLLYFMEESRGMTEREKDVFVAAFVRWGKKGGAFRKGCAVVAIFCLLAYYHAIGKRLGESGLHEKYLKQTC